MTSSKEIYKKFLLAINKNDTNSNIKISKGEFVLLFNEQMLSWFNSEYEKLLVSDRISELGYLLVKDKELSEFKKDATSVFFNIPKGVSKYSSSYSIANKGSCSTPLVNWLVKPKNINSLLSDDNSSPSFEYEETICIMAEDKLVVYVKDFSITKQFLSYYKEPAEIDLEGYVKIDGSNSSNKDTDLEDDHINDVLKRCAIEVSIRYGDASGSQLSAARMNL